MLCKKIIKSKKVLISSFLFQTKAQATHDLLRDKYNRAVATQIQLTVRRYHSFSILFTNSTIYLFTFCKGPFIYYDFWKSMHLVMKISKNWHSVIHTSIDIIPPIFLDRVNTAGTVNASQTEASKAEEDFKNLQEQKKAQDLYLNKLSKDMEDLEQKALEYQSQVIQKCD